MHHKAGIVTSQPMSHSSVCDIAGSAHACDITSVQLKREDMLKMKCTQLERQINMLQAALQVKFASLLFMKNSNFCMLDQCESWHQYWPHIL